MANWYPTEFERYLTLLQAIEREPRWKTTRQLADLLARKGELAATDRTVQRILEYFQERFRLKSRVRKGERGRPREWAWPKHGGTIPFPTMDAPAALTYQLAAELLAPLLPAAFLDELAPELKRAQKVLGLASRRTVSLAGKLTVLPRGTGRLPARIEPQVLRAVENCLMEGRQLIVIGRLLGPSDETLELLVHPIALVFRIDTMYLVAGIHDTDGGHTDWIALHRVDHAECTEEPAVQPADFDLDRTLKEVRRHRLPVQLFDESDRPVRLRGRILRPDLLDTLKERPFSSDQTISHQDGESIVEATVTVTRDLLAELHDFGADLEVLKPPALRDHMFRAARKLHALYADANADDHPKTASDPIRLIESKGVRHARHHR